MKDVYSQQEISNAFNTKKRLLILWLLFFALFIVFEGALFGVHLYRVETMLDRTYQNAFIFIAVAIAAVFSFISIPFFSIKYRYTKAYCRMYNDMRDGLRDVDNGVVLEIKKDPVEKNAVLFWSVVVECPPVRRMQRNERTVLIEQNHDLDDITIGAKMEFISHSGMLISYEIKNTSEDDK